MPEVEITKKQIIVVDQIGENSYGDLTFTDKDGKEYKVGTKRRQYFDDVILPGKAVQLNYSKFKGREYIYNAEPVEKMLPEKPPTEKKPVADTPETMTKSDWAEKDKTTRKSIERQKSLELALYAMPEKTDVYSTVALVIALAKIFEQYLEFGTIQQALPSKSTPSSQPTKDNLPETENKPLVDEVHEGKIVDGITDPQTKKIQATIKEKKILARQARLYLKVNFGKEHLKELTKKEASHFIEDLISGKIVALNPLEQQLSELEIESERED